MIASKSMITADKTIAPHYGNLSTAIASCTMDIDVHPSHSLRHPKDEESDAMDLSVDGRQEDARDLKHIGAVSDEPAPVPQDAQAVLERPRDEEGRASVVTRQAYIPAKPELSKDLLSLYNLHAVVASVARTDPVTGEKINRLRKSYEGKVKSLGLAGRNRAVKHEKDKMVGLVELAFWPEEEWQTQKVLGREIQTGLPSATLAKLDKAMRMQSGPIPNNNEWEDLLGFEKAAPIQPVVESFPRTQRDQREVQTVNANAATNGALPKPRRVTTSEVPRPKRNSKKRRYDEQSFEGYGEGFVDDEGETIAGVSTGGGGYSSGDGSRKSGPSKKRRKEYGSANPSGLNERTGSYGVGMMGMSNGIGAYSQ